MLISWIADVRSWGLSGGLGWIVTEAVVSLPFLCNPARSTTRFRLGHWKVIIGIKLLQYVVGGGSLKTTRGWLWREEK